MFQLSSMGLYYRSVTTTTRLGLVEAKRWEAIFRGVNGPIEHEWAGIYLDLI